MGLIYPPHLTRQTERVAAMYTLAITVTLFMCAWVALMYDNPTKYHVADQMNVMTDNALIGSIALNVVLFTWLVAVCIKHGV